MSLDQFRGYTVAGMLFVNFLGSFHALPAVFKHHNLYCSYADTIMPQFFFAVGFAYRLTFLRRLQNSGFATAFAAVVRARPGTDLARVCDLSRRWRSQDVDQLQELGFRGFVTTAFQRNLLQTLVHIGLTSIWVLPVIAAGARRPHGFPPLLRGSSISVSRPGSTSTGSGTDRESTVVRSAS